jgi:peptide/nickel transport system permease protein
LIRGLHDEQRHELLNQVTVPAETPDLTEHALTGTQAVPSTVVGRAVVLARVLLRDPLLVVGVVIVAISLFLVVMGPWMAPYDPQLPTPDVSQAPPALSDVPSLILQALQGKLHHPVHWFGTDSTGLDVFSRVLVAPRVDVVVGLAATTLSFILGTLLGLFAGFFGTRSAESIIRVSDVFQSFPIFILAMILVVLTGRNVIDIIVTLACLYTPIYLRLTCSQVVSQVGRTYVEAARAVGNREIVIALKHVLPNSLTPALIQASVTIGWAILFTAGLTFLGAGVRPPTPEWGGMIAASANYLVLGEWWPSVFPGIAISVTVFGYAIIGNVLEARYRQ